MVIPSLKMAWHGDTQSWRLSVTMPVLVSSTRSSVQHCIQVLPSSKEKKKRESHVSAQGTSIETVQALSFVSLMTLIAMFGLFSFPANKAGIANVNITNNQLKINKETISPSHYCEI